MPTTTWYAGTAGDVLVDEQNKAHAGLTVDLFTDKLFATRASHLCNEAGDDIGSTPSAVAGGAVRFGDPAGGTRTYYSPRRYTVTAGVATPDPTGGSFEWRPDPAQVYALVIKDPDDQSLRTKILGSGIADVFVGGKLVNPSDVGDDLVVAVHQSNNLGRATDFDTVNIDVSDARVWVYPTTGPKVGQFVLAQEPLPYQSTTGMGPSLTFSRLLASVTPTNRRIVPIVCAVGGTPYGGAAPFGTWDHTRTDVSAASLLPQAAVAQVKAVYAASAAMGRKPRIVVITSVHGESDGDNGTSGAAYQAADDEFFAWFRAQLQPMSASADLIPVVRAGMAPDYLSTGTRTAIRATQVDAARRLSRYAYVDGPAGMTKGDGNHYRADGQREIARRMFNALARARANVTGTAPLPPTIDALSQSGTSLTIALGLPNARVTDTQMQTSLDQVTWTTVAKPSPSLELTGTTTAALGATVFVRARTLNEQGQSAWSTTSSITMLRSPNAVTGLAAGTPAFTSVPLSWTAPAVDGTHDAATSYLVEDKRGAGSYVVFGTVTDVAALVNGLADGSNYTFRVTSQNAAGQGAAVTVTAATPQLTALLNAGVLSTTASQGGELRLIRGAYSGPCVNVRRDNGDTTDIGFVGSNLDVPSLLAFAGSTGNCWVTKVYDQGPVGTRHDLNLTTGYQPKIVVNGALVANPNGTPAMEFDGVDDHLTNTWVGMYAAGSCSVALVEAPVGGGLSNAVVMTETKLAANAPEYDLVRQSPSGAQMNQYLSNDAGTALIPITSTTSVVPAVFANTTPGAPRSIIITDTGTSFSKYVNGVLSPSAVAYARTGSFTPDVSAVGARPKTAGPTNPAPVRLSGWIRVAGGVFAPADITTITTSHQQYYATT